MDPKFPDVVVRLSGEDGNAFSIIARVTRAMRRAGVERGDIALFQMEAASGNYDHMLQTCMRWVSTT